MKIYLTAIVHVKPAHVEYVKYEMQQLVVQSRAEIACIQYDLHQGKENKNIFIFYEIWENQDGLDNHNNQPHFLEYKHKVEDFFVHEPDIYYAELIG